MRSLIAALALGCLSIPALSHDIYPTLKSPQGFSCCGGEDCEAATDYTINPDKSVTLFSRRHNATIRISDKIWREMQLPPNDDGIVYPAHWCGYRNTHEDKTGDQIDPNFHTWCAFIAPGGV